MKKRIILFVVFCMCLLLLGSPAEAFWGSDYATFESFYKKSSSIGWIIGGILALGTAAVVFFTGGLASPLVAPFVATVGTSIGGVMGLSGIAATNAGLALLGGGAIAAGGLGIAGGAALLSAVVTFSTGVIADYGISKITSHYSYSELCESTKDFPNFPPFENTDGPKEIKKVVTYISANYDVNELPSTTKNQNIYNNAYWILNGYRDEDDKKGAIRIQSAKALISFMMNDHHQAMRDAKDAIQIGMDLKTEYSVPLFVLAASGMMTQNIKVNQSVDYFKECVIHEKNNKLLPLLYSIYVSRAGELGEVDASFLSKLYYILDFVSDDRIKETCMMQLITTYMSKLKINQMDITLVYKNIDSDFVKNKEVLQKIQFAMFDYETLLGDLGEILNKIKAKEDSSAKMLHDIRYVLSEYKKDSYRLKSMVEFILKSQPQNGISL